MQNLINLTSVSLTLFLGFFCTQCSQSLNTWKLQFSFYLFDEQDRFWNITVLRQFSYGNPNFIVKNSYKYLQIYSITKVEQLKKLGYYIQSAIICSLTVAHNAKITPLSIMFCVIWKKLSSSRDYFIIKNQRISIER